ncbi:hypothetical protein SVA_0553 [Sulfurifustis variabilis]|uniref:Uncharacterized protein n=1 Tax=Sulfurifustis variabilis TaxID=1675686 RepID=A0A1B4V748_9GAMM|nr:hypothetical protein [Sulfurifustis variabilis]BAU47134.1 hypothetical protein SVA_0553 [Sulfurifustis variabilis]
MANRDHFIAPREREALVSLTAVSYIEEHHLLTAAQLEEAKKSLQALFLRASGEETLLRRLIEVLKTTRALHQSFSSIAGTLAGARQSAATVEERLLALREYLKHTPVSAEAHAEFVGPFLSFSQAMANRMAECARLLGEYLDRKEGEARAQTLYRIALDARERLRLRLAGQLAAEPHGEAETRIKQELVASFDYGEAESALKAAMRESRLVAGEVEESLGQLHAMCRLAMNPAMRDLPSRLRPPPPHEDVYTRFAEALPRRPELHALRNTVVELFRLYQHAYGLLKLDYDKLRRATETMMQNTEAYFQAKEEDLDLAEKREKLRKIEGLIPFLEHSAGLAAADTMDTYHKFSRELSALIASRRAPWSHVAEDLLRSKVQAEAELSTRL